MIAAPAPDGRSPPPEKSGGRKPDFRFIDLPVRGPACYMAMGPDTAPTLVFLHGFGGDLLTWQFCLLALARRFRVVALDLPGHGRASLDVGAGSLADMVTWTEAALAALAIGPAHVVGHSMGGKIALSLAEARPDRVLSLTLIASAGLGGRLDRALLERFLDCRSSEIALEVAGRLLAPGSIHLAPALAKSMLSAIESAERRQALAALLGPGSITDEALRAEGVRWDRIACPIQILWGAEDVVVAQPDSASLPQNAAVTILPGAGHVPQLEKPTQVIALINRFLS